MANKNLTRLAIGATVVAAASAAAGAVLANRELRKNLGRRTTQALEVVSDLAKQVEKFTNRGGEKKAAKKAKPKRKTKKS